MMKHVEYYLTAPSRVFIKGNPQNPLNYLQRPYRIGLYAYNFFIFASFPNTLDFVFDYHGQQRF